MKPLKLRMKAFGSYANEAIVDFEMFGQDLYLITGDTGAGKTTIFDAIMFALYGKASGSNRDWSMFHSDFVSKGVATEVELDFEHAGKTHCVIREIKYSKRRGTENEYGDAKQTAVLKESEKPPISGDTRVTARITEMLGIDADQFRKIVMLAQGEFRKFLDENTEKRSQILGQLFDTKPYLGFQNRLNGATKRLVDMREENIRKSRVIMESSFVMPEGLSHEEQARYNVNHPQLIENLKSLIARDIATASELEAQLHCQEKRYIELGKKQQKAIEDNKKLDSFGAVSARKEQLEQQKTEIDALKAQIMRVDRVWRTVRPVEQRYQEKRKELELLTAEIAMLSNEVEAALGSVNECKRGAEKCAETEMQIDALKQKSADLEKTIPEYDKLSAKTAELEAQNKELARMTRREKALAEALEETKRTLLQIERDLKVLADAEKDLVLSEKEEERAQAVLDAITGPDGITSKVSALKTLELEIAAHSDRLSRQTVAAGKLHDAYNSVYNAYIYAQAGVLASELCREIEEKGSGICPVCNTVHGRNHQDFAESTEYVPAKEQVDEAQENWKKAEDQRNALQTELEGKKAGAEEKKRALLHDAKQVFGESHWDVLKSADYLTSKTSEAEEMLNLAVKRHRDAAAAVSRKRRLLEQQEKKKSDQAGCETSVKELHEKISGKKSEISGAATALEILKSGLEYPTKAAAQKKLEELGTQRGILQKEVNAAKTALDTAKNRYSTALGKLSNARRRVPETEEAERMLADQYQAVLLKCELDEDAYRQTLALAGDDGEVWIKSKEAIVSRYQIDVATVESDFTRLAKETEGLVRTDTNALEEAVHSAEAAKNNAANAYHNADAIRRNHQKTLAQIESIHAELQTSESAYQRLRKLSVLAAGTEAKEDGKVSFERYAMGSIFQDILALANERLDIMSCGKYELVHAIKGKTANSQAGLEIEVLDRVSGGRRKTGSFSGGESFLVSMALALGLSDAVQNRSGGVAMESMFIDEGFGSLGDTALASAISVLENLSKGQRQVGIISHVTQLEGCIPKKIRVANGDSGSSLRQYI